MLTTVPSGSVTGVPLPAYPFVIATSFGDVVSSVSVTANNAADQRIYLVYDKDGRQRYTLSAVDASNWLVSENRYDANSNVIETRRYDKTLSDARVTAIAPAGISVAEVAFATQYLTVPQAQAALFPQAMVRASSMKVPASPETSTVSHDSALMRVPLI